MEKNLDLGSVINIPDPQHWWKGNVHCATFFRPEAVIGSCKCYLSRADLQPVLQQPDGGPDCVPHQQVTKVFKLADCWETMVLILEIESMRSRYFKLSLWNWNRKGTGTVRNRNFLPQRNWNRSCYWISVSDPVPEPET